MSTWWIPSRSRNDRDPGGVTGTVHGQGMGERAGPGSRISVPVAVVLERRIDPERKWGYPVWRVHGILTGEGITALGGDSVVEVDGNTSRFIHTGFTLDLYKDGGEGYWYNLLSDKPHLFVVCEGEYGAREIRPMLVTANQDEASGHMEADDMVLSAPMPEEITELLERYVISHYQPQIKRKRKRRDWLEDSLYAASRDGDAGDGVQ